MPIQLSGCAILNAKQELLLLWKTQHGHYEFPGGKVEEGESLEEAARRECREELGVEVEVGPLLYTHRFTIDGKDLESHKFFGTLPSGAVPQIMEPEKFGHLLWMPLSAYGEYSCAPNVVGFCQFMLTQG
jgi:8-oxo-dGTP pyrophosphatase MutT (NUDIX family)